jgi:hypothetical protein
MAWVGFEPMIPASERAKTVYVLDRSATVTGETLLRNCKTSYSYLLLFNNKHFELQWKCRNRRIPYCSRFGTRYKDCTYLQQNVVYNQCNLNCETEVRVFIYTHCQSQSQKDFEASYHLYFILDEIIWEHDTKTNKITADCVRHIVSYKNSLKLRNSLK